MSENKEYPDDPLELMEALNKEVQKSQKKTLKEFRESLGDTGIRVVNTVQVAESLKGNETLLEKLQKSKPLWQLRDGKGETFYLFDPSKKDLPSIPELTKIRDRILEQRTAWNNLPTDQRAQIGAAYTSSRETPVSARPYQDYLHSHELGKVFEGAKKT